MYAIHMEPSGSSYTATKEEFLSRTPLPLTDCTVGKDGALYFTIGGRGAQSELYRVIYVGQEDTQQVDVRSVDPAQVFPTPSSLRAERRKLEALHVESIDRIRFISSKAPAETSHALGSTDRQIRYAARIVMERLPLEVLEGTIYATPHHIANAQNASEWLGAVNRLIEGCVAFARQGEPNRLPKIVSLLGELKFDKLDEEHQLNLLRAYQLAFIRLGNPDEQTCAALAKKFDDLFPQKSDFVNCELAILMIHFQSPNAAKKLVPLLAQERNATAGSGTRQSSDEGGSNSSGSLATSATGAIATNDLLSRNSGYGGTIAAMLANQPDQQQYFYAFNLRNLKAGWTLDLRKTYFAWFNKARTWSGGASYPKFLTNIDNEAFANCTDTERLAIEASGVRKPYVAPELPKPIGPGHEYTVDEVIAMATDKLRGRDFKNGEKMYKAARCVVCHRFGGDGGATGPDLTQLAGRFNLKDLTDAIVDPSKVISDQFRASVVVTTGGQIYAGLVFSKQDGTLTVLTDPEDISKVVKVPADQVDEVTPSKVSLMPKDLLKTLNQDEVLDLLAYLLSRGNPGDAMFKK